MSTYKDLQAKAKELGLKYVGVSEKDLRVAIKEAEKKPATPTKEAPEKPKVKDEVDSDENRDAVVYNGKHKVRTYTKEQHGKDYINLAKQYASHPEREDYRVELERVENRIKCPHCGMKFRL